MRQRTEVWFIDPLLAPWTKGAGELVLVRWTGKRSYEVQRYAGAYGYAFRHRKHWEESTLRTFVGYL